MKTILLPFLLAALAPVSAFAGTIAPTKPEVKKFDKADTSNDESISLAEFAALMKVLTKAKAGGPGNAVELQVVADAFFDWFDTNNSNSIDLGEWFTARTSSPLAPGIPDFVTFSGIDLNGDEFVKAGEFVKVLKEIIPAKLAVALFKTV